jgi:hypothetical protein
MLLGILDDASFQMEIGWAKKFWIWQPMYWKTKISAYVADLRVC